jgi:hypothetical protein
MDTKNILAELRDERTKIDQAIRAIEGISSDGATRPATKRTATAAHKKRRMSAATRRRLSMLLKRRWAQGKMKGRAKPRANATRTAKKATAAARASRKGGISAAGRKRLSEMMKKRWAERKKAKAATA